LEIRLNRGILVTAFLSLSVLDLNLPGSEGRRFNPAPGSGVRLVLRDESEVDGSASLG